MDADSVCSAEAGISAKKHTHRRPRQQTFWIWCHSINGLQCQSYKKFAAIVYVCHCQKCLMIYET